jgi:hypothetical protein
VSNLGSKNSLENPSFPWLSVVLIITLFIACGIFAYNRKSQVLMIMDDIKSSSESLRNNNMEEGEEEKEIEMKQRVPLLSNDNSDSSPTSSPAVKGLPPQQVLPSMNLSPGGQANI